MIDQKTVLDLFDYCDGRLFWRVQLNPRAPVGAEAGTYNSANGRRYVRIKGRAYLAHRLIFLFHHGYLPPEIDHIDLDKNNNKIENLRAATPAQNQKNKSLQRNNTSGHKNICFKKGRWVVELKIAGKQQYFGRFEDLDLAILVASEARDKYHGEFANHG